MNYPAVTIGMTLLFVCTGCGNHVASMDQNTGRLADTTESMEKHTKKLSDELERDRAYIKAITEQLSSMAKSMEEFRELAQVLKNFLASLSAQKTTPAKTPDIDDILGSTDPGSTHEESKEKSI